MLALLNLVAMACEAILVLFAQGELGLGGVGFGLLLAASAAGGLLGSVVAPRLGRQVGTGRLLVAVTLLNAACYLLFGLSSNPWVAGVTWAIGLRAPFLLAAAVRVAVGLLALPVLTNSAVHAARGAAGAAPPIGDR
jgi:Na+/melibiose symporter-like transporter